MRRDVKLEPNVWTRSPCAVQQVQPRTLGGSKAKFLNQSFLDLFGQMDYLSINVTTCKFDIIQFNLNQIICHLGKQTRQTLRNRWSTVFVAPLHNQSKGLCLDDSDSLAGSNKIDMEHVHANCYMITGLGSTTSTQKLDLRRMTLSQQAFLHFI